MDTGLDFMGSRKGSEQDSTVRRKVSEHEPATFEEAITATKFGKFNIILALLSMVATLCTVFDTTTMSYGFVAAQCDLNLSLTDKGALNSMTYIGMITSALVWGFLFDVLGRKKLLSIGFLVDAIFVFMSAISQDLTLLLISKFLQGFIINGPFAALSTYMSEFHCSKYRPGFQLLIGTCISIGTIILPLIAWSILPHNMDFTIVNLNFHSWNVFLAISGLPAFLSGLIFLFFPESPKFLMTCGENEKALAVFKKVYRLNTGLPEDTYPIKKLIEETKLTENNKHGGQITAQRTKAQALREGFQQIKPLFYRPYLTRILLSCGIVFSVHLSLNMLRLWLPQIFQLMTDYELAHNGSSASLCVMLTAETSTNGTTEECVVNNDNSTVYKNSAIVGFTSACGCMLVGSIIRLVGKKKLFLITTMLGSICCASIIFATNPAMALAGSSLFIASATVCNNVMTSIAVDLFPTSLRTLAVATGLMIGRIGGMTGTYIFPYLLESGCEPPFIVVASFLLAAFVLSIFLPDTDGKPLT